MMKIPDFASIAGQDHAKRALEVAACGGHHLVLTGASGNGKSLLAQALVGLLPPRPTHAIHELETSPRPVIQGQDAMGWIEAALAGYDGSLIKSLHGVLILDRLDSFGYSTLQIQRLGVILDRYPSIQMMLTRQPCPCGFYGDPIRECCCTADRIVKHQLRIHALRERAPMEVEIPRLEYERIMQKRPPEATALVAERVREGALWQRTRFASLPLTRNAEMDHAQIQTFCVLEDSAERLFKTAVRQLHCSARAVNGILSLARTVADLAASEQIQANHIAEAVQYLPRLDRP